MRRTIYLLILLVVTGALWIADAQQDRRDRFRDRDRNGEQRSRDRSRESLDRNRESSEFVQGTKPLRLKD